MICMRSATSADMQTSADLQMSANLQPQLLSSDLATTQTIYKTQLDLITLYLGIIKTSKYPNIIRIWTSREEKVLINALKDIVNNGWKPDNDFRAGYLTKCEDALKEDFTKMDLQETPHITSQMTAWKKNYSSLITAHTTTCVGFNTTTS
ncbi:hypothetical protein ACS0TY_010674 [Phlomoides rotata]